MSLPQALTVPSTIGTGFKVNPNLYKNVMRGGLRDSFFSLLLYTFISFLNVLEYEK